MLVHVRVANAIRMSQHWHSRMLLNVAHKSIAAAWHKEIDRVVERQHGLHIFTGFDHAYGISSPGLYTGQGLLNELAQNPVRFLGFSATFHNDSIPCLPTQRRNLWDSIR